MCNSRAYILFILFGGTWKAATRRGRVVWSVRPFFFSFFSAGGSRGQTIPCTHTVARICCYTRRRRRRVSNKRVCVNRRRRYRYILLLLSPQRVRSHSSTAYIIPCFDRRLGFIRRHVRQSTNCPPGPDKDKNTNRQWNDARFNSMSFKRIRII